MKFWFRQRETQTLLGTGNTRRGAHAAANICCALTELASFRSYILLLPFLICLIELRDQPNAAKHTSILRALFLKFNGHLFCLLEAYLTTLSSADIIIPE